jgi:hypothetical protein
MLHVKIMIDHDNKLLLIPKRAMYNNLIEKLVFPITTYCYK